VSGKLWTRGDVRAEIDRQLAAAKAAKTALVDTVGRLKALGKESGFEDDASLGIEGLQAALFGTPSALPEPKEGDFAEQIRAVMGGFVKDDEAGGKGLGVRYHPLVFDREMDAGSDYLDAQPQLTFRPTLLLVHPTCAEGDLVGFRAGNCETKINNPPMPLSFFSPSTWADASLMSRARLDAPTIHPAQKLTLMISVPKAVRFRAVVLGYAVSESPPLLFPAGMPEMPYESVYDGGLRAVLSADLVVRRESEFLVEVIKNRFGPPATMSIGDWANLLEAHPEAVILRPKYSPFGPRAMAALDPDLDILATRRGSDPKNPALVSVEKNRFGKTGLFTPEAYQNLLREHPEAKVLER